MCSAAASWQGQAPLSLALPFSDRFQRRFISVLPNEFILRTLFFRWHFANGLGRPAARVDDNWLKVFFWRLRDCCGFRLVLDSVSRVFGGFFFLDWRKFRSCMKWLCAVLKKNGWASRQGRQNLRRRVRLFQARFEVVSRQQRVGFFQLSSSAFQVYLHSDVMALYLGRSLPLNCL